MDDNQKVLFLMIIIPFIVLIVLWIHNIGCENYSPFKNTGDIDSHHTGYTYLDEYEQQQYYKNNPWIYPTPTSYIRLLYDEERNNIKYLESQRKKMLKKMKNTNY